MATLAEYQQTITDLQASLTNLTPTMDNLATRIQAMQAGQVVTQEELDALSAQVNAARAVAMDAATRVGTLAQSPPTP